MKPILPCLLVFLLMHFSVSAQDRFRIQVDPQSTLEITGYSNINSFSLCCSAIHAGTEIRPSVTGTEVNEITNIRAEWVLPLIHFNTDNASIKEGFLELVNQKQYPVMRIFLKHITLFDSSNDGNDGDAIVDITLGGVTRTYAIRFHANLDHNGLITTGHQKLNIRDFNLEPPTKLFGLIHVKENIDIDFHMVFLLTPIPSNSLTSVRP